MILARLRRLDLSSSAQGKSKGGAASPGFSIVVSGRQLSVVIRLSATTLLNLVGERNGGGHGDLTGSRPEWRRSRTSRPRGTSRAAGPLGGGGGVDDRSELEIEGGGERLSLRLCVLGGLGDGVVAGGGIVAQVEVERIDAIGAGGNRSVDQRADNIERAGLDRDGICGAIAGDGRFGVAGAIGRRIRDRANSRRSRFAFVAELGLERV